MDIRLPIQKMRHFVIYEPDERCAAAMSASSCHALIFVIMLLRFSGTKSDSIST